MKPTRIILIVLFAFLIIGGVNKVGSLYTDTVHRLSERPNSQPVNDENAQASNSDSDQSDCERVKGAVVVTLDHSDYPGTTEHVREAIASGQPAVLHLDRDGADANRDASLEGIPTKDGYDRDEWPMAVSSEGGAGADIAYVESSDNRGAGSKVGAQLAPFCDGQAFRVKIVP